MSLSQTAMKAAGWVLVEKWSVRLLSLVVFAVLTRFVAVEDFGIISMATVCIAFLSVFVESGFAKVLVQRKSFNQLDASTAFWTSLFLAVVLYAGLFFTAPLLATLFGEPGLTDVLRVSGTMLIFTAFSSVPVAMLEREFKFKAIATRQVIGTVLGAASAIPLALTGFGVWALVAQTVVTAATSAVVLWVLSDWRPSFKYSYSALKSMTSFGFSVMMIDLLNAVQGNIDKLLIGAFFDPTTLGYYFVAQRALNIMSELVTTVLGRISLTAFSKVQDDLNRLNRGLRQVTFGSAIIAIPVFGIAALVSPQLVPFVFGADWAPAIWVFALLAPSAALMSVTYFDRSVLLAAGRPKSALGLSLGQNLVGIALVFAALPFGMYGVALSRSIRVLLFWPVRLLVLKKAVHTPIAPYLSQVWRSFAAFLPVAAIILGLQFTPWAAMDHSFLLFALPVSVAGGVLYAVLAWWFAGHENRAFIRQMTGNRIPVLRARKRKA